MQQQFEEEEAERLGYTPEQYREIVARAERIRGERGERLTRDALQESAAEIGISQQDLEEAERQIQAERQRQLASAAQRKARMQVAAIIAACLVAFSLLFTVVAYNDLNTRRAAVTEARANLQVQLERKAELIPQIERVTGRSDLAGAGAALRSGDLKAQLEANDALRGVEQAIPASLADSIEGAENRISTHRTRYSSAATRYNQAAQSFPRNLVRGLFGLPAEIPPYQAATGR
jgi:LemA protein